MTTPRQEHDHSFDHIWHDWGYYIVGGIVLALQVWHKVGYGLPDAWKKTIEGIEQFVVLLLLFMIASRLKKVDDAQKANFTHVLASLRETEVERMHALRGRLDPGFNAVFGHHLDTSLENLVSAIEQKQIKVTDVDEFRRLYKETLERFPDSTFLATSSPTLSYFWGDPYIRDAVRKFTRRGRMKRIFLLNVPLDRLSADEHEVIRLNHDLGVDVYTVETHKLPQHLRALFFVSGNEHFMWEVRTAPGTQDIQEVIGTSDPAKAQHHIGMWNDIKALASPYTPVHAHLTTHARVALEDAVLPRLP